MDYGGLPGPIKLQNIWGSSAHDLWGMNGDSPDVRDCLWHYDGTRWTRATAGTPITEFTGNKVVYDVWGSGRDNVWTVGRKISHDSLTAFIMHYDGNTWRDATPPNVQQLNNVLYSIYGIASNDFWVYGYEYAIHFDGAEWRPIKVADSMIVGSLYSNDRNLLASSYSPWGRLKQFLYCFSGDDFMVIDSTNENEKKFGVWLWLHDHTITTFTNGIIENRVSDTGAVLSNAWTRQLTTPTYFRAPYIQTRNNVFVTGQWNLFYHFNGVNWAPISIVVPNHTVDPHAILGRAWSDGNEVFLCDYDNGIVYHGR